MAGGKMIVVSRPTRKGTKARKSKAKKRDGLDSIPKQDHMAKAVIGKSVGFYKNKNAILKYVERVPITTTLGAFTLYQFRANGMFDPNITSTGHQPYTFDQHSIFYNHYRVHKARMKITTVGNGTNTMLCGCYLSDDTTVAPIANANAIIETGRGQHAYLPQDISASRTMYVDFDVDKFFSKDVDRGDTSAPVTADPTEQAVFSIWVESMDGTVENAITSFLVEIDYHAKFYEPKDLGQS